MPRYVDVEDAIYELERAFPVDDYGKIIRCISRTPTANVVEQKRGKWIIYYECPNCGEIAKDFTEYCPFCNADMRGEENG